MLVDWDISIRRACKVLRFDTSTYHYKSRRTGQAPLERRIKEICETRVRYGYRRVHVHLLRDGWKINMKKTRRIYSELGLQLRNKHPKRRVKAKLRDDRQEAAYPNRGRYALALLPSRRRPLHLSRRRRGPDLGRHLQEVRLSEDDKGG